MTTSWSLLTRGRVVESLQTNPGGTLLAVVAFFFGPWLLLTGLKGRWIFGEPGTIFLVALGGVAMTVTLAHWIFRLTQY